MQSLIKGKASYVIAWFLLFYWILAAFVVSERFLTNKSSTSQPEENASAADLTQLRTMVEQLSERINKLNNGTAVGSARNDAGLEGLQRDLNKLSTYVKNINLTVPAPIITVKETVSRAAVEDSRVHIKNTHPALMKYRYAEADADTNSGKPFEAVLKPDLVLLEENGMKFWGWNFSFMVEYVFDKAGGEQLVRDVFKVVLGRLKTPKLVLDVGSNVGYFSLIAALYNTQRIYSFDPQRLCTKRLSESAKFNGFDSRIAAINAYVSKDEKGVAFFPTDTCGGSFSVTDDNAGKNADVTHAEVHSVNLDTIFLADPDYIDLMKVDVEGAELMVLEGAQELLKKHRIRNLVIEITTGWWNSSFGIQYETGAKLIKEALVDSGYKVWLMPISVSATFIKVEGWDELDKILRPPPGYHNQKNFLFTLDEF